MVTDKETRFLTWLRFFFYSRI